MPGPWLRRTLISFLLVDDVHERLAFDEAFQVLFHGSDHARIILIGAAGDVGGDDHVVEFPERVAFGQGFGIGDIDTRAGKLPAIEALHETVHIVNAAAAYCDEVRVRLHQIEFV